ncbi:MAG TPA: 3-hydroxyacyl-CoA dehydrogenase family protein, partial [Methanomicrobia archaeon]|nr:3-hydroxyacyl-CoA dehydrogenase family protein [Methanomicrobia archaeon]
MKSRNEKRVCVVGMGVMGSGIVQVCTQAGYEVSVVGRSEESLKREQGKLKSSLSRLAEKGLLKQEEAGRIVDAVSANATTSLEEGARGADFVIEAVYEELGLKQEIFRELDRICPEHAVLGSNTSTFPITALAAATKGERAEKVIGVHFMNPVPLMPGVEIIKSLMTSEETVRRTLDFVHSLGKQTVTVKDSPGFVTSRMMCLILNEAVKMRENELASVEDIDKILRLSFNWPLGPFQLLDLIGIEIVVAVLNTIYNETGWERFKPAVLMTQMVRAGWTGRKVGKGFY